MSKTTANKPALKVLDLKKDLKHLYNPSAKEVVLVDVPEMQFLMIDGAGDPNTAQEYSDAVSALYSMAYTLKFLIERFTEGLAAQILHIGPYSAEKPTVEKIHSFIHEQGYSLTGKHHEIYLGDPRKAAPEKLKTVIRQPCKK